MVQFYQLCLALRDITKEYDEVLDYLALSLKFVNYAKLIRLSEVEDNMDDD